MLKDKLKEDLKTAMKAGDSERRSVIGMALAAIQNRELDKRTKLSKTKTDPSKLEELSKLSDEETLEVIGSEVKKRKDSAIEYAKGGRPELAGGEKKEIEILAAYLPDQMPEEGVRKEVKKIISETGAKDIKDMGKVIGAVMTKVKGRVDGTLVSKIVKEELTN